jgi:hypothetical protein
MRTPDRQEDLESFRYALDNDRDERVGVGLPRPAPGLPPAGRTEASRILEALGIIQPLESSEEPAQAVQTGELRAALHGAMQALRTGVAA